MEGCVYKRNTGVADTGRALEITDILDVEVANKEIMLGGCGAGVAVWRAGAEVLERGQIAARLHVEDSELGNGHSQTTA